MRLVCPIVSYPLISFVFIHLTYIVSNLNFPQEFLEDLKEDPEYAKEQVCEKLTDVKEQTKEFVLKTKEQIESGEITLDTVLDKAKYHAQQATEASKETLNHFKSQLEEKVIVEENENGQEIVIELQEN